MKTTRFSQKRIERPQRILEAAAKLIAQSGYDKTTMEDIALEAGVSKGALYLTWPGKEQLFDALLEHEMKNMLLDLRQRIEAEPEGCSLSWLYTHTLMAMQRNPLVTALYTHDGRILGDFVKRQNPDRYTQRLTLSTEAIQQYQSAGLIRSDLPAQAIAYVFSLLALGFMSISSILPADSAPPLEETVLAMSALVQSGFAQNNNEQKLPKAALFQMIDLMLEQNQGEVQNE